MAKNPKAPMRKSPVRVETLTHDDATRKNIPTAEYQSVMMDEHKHPLRVAYERRPLGHRRHGPSLWGAPNSCVRLGSPRAGVAESDVDFLVDFPPGYDLFAQRLPLAEGLSELIGRKVDLVPEHELNRHIRQQVLDEAVDL